METKVILKALEENGFRLTAADPCLLMLSLNEVVAECVNRPLDIKRLQGILMAKGYRVASNDPVFLILTINKILLEDMVKQQQLAINKNAQSIFSLPEKTVKPPKSSTSFAWPITGAGISLLIFAGWMILEAAKMPLLQVVIGIVLGTGLGALGMLLRSKLTEPEENNSKSTYQLPAVQTWNELDFHKTINLYGRQTFGTEIDAKTQIALFDFFCRGADLGLLFVKHNLPLNNIAPYIDNLKKFKSSQPK